MWIDEKRTTKLLLEYQQVQRHIWSEKDRPNNMQEFGCIRKVNDQVCIENMYTGSNMNCFQYADIEH